MKMIFCAAALATCFPVFANLNDTRDKMVAESKKQMRREKREERKELWLHEVNWVTEAQFNKDFPDAKEVTWKEAAFSEATFYDDIGAKTAYYDRDNDLVGITREVDFSLLPDKAKQYISKKYTGYTLEKVIFFEDNQDNQTDMVLFNSSFEDKNNYFPVLVQDSKQVILKVTEQGDVSVFRTY